MVYVLEMEQNGERVGQDFKDQETLMLVLQAMLDGTLPMECKVSKFNPDLAVAYDEWEGKGESRHDR